MKKLFTLAVCCVALMTQASAQIKKGEKMLGGGFGFTESNIDFDFPAGTVDDYKRKNTSVVISPQFGFGLSNNWVVGAKVGINIQSEKIKGDIDPTTKSYSINPGVFVRKYTTIGERFGLFGQGDLSYGFGKSEFTQTNSPSSERKTQSVGVSIKPGMFFRANKRFVIEATFGNFGYTHLISKPGDEPDGVKITMNNVDLSVTNGLSLGFQLVL